MIIDYEFILKMLGHESPKKEMEQELNFKSSDKC